MLHRLSTRILYLFYLALFYSSIFMTTEEGGVACKEGKCKKKSHLGHASLHKDKRLTTLMSHM